MPAYMLSSEAGTTKAGQGRLIGFDWDRDRHANGLSTITPDESTPIGTPVIPLSLSC